MAWGRASFQIAPKYFIMATKNLNNFRSSVADLVDFGLLENPSWRTETSTAPSPRQMIKEIVGFRREWDTVKHNYDKGFVDEVKRQLEAKFFYHCNIGEDHGLRTVGKIKEFLTSNKETAMSGSNLSLEEQETANLKDAYSYLNSECDAQDPECRGLLEESMLRKVNEIVLRNITRSKCLTRPGIYSDRARIAQFNGEIYYYQQPGDMTEAVCLLLDRYNSVFTESMSKTDEEEKLEGIFKSVAWLVFELLDLHPFSDGNGRLCRLLCSYILSTFAPFPSPIYNMYSESSRMDFERTLVETRKSPSRQPQGLATMIIESNWAMWKKLKEVLAKSVQSEAVSPDVSQKVSQLSPKCSQSLLPSSNNQVSKQVVTNIA